MFLHLWVPEQDDDPRRPQSFSYIVFTRRVRRVNRVLNVRPLENDLRETVSNQAVHIQHGGLLSHSSLQILMVFFTFW